MTLVLTTPLVLTVSLELTKLLVLNMLLMLTGWLCGWLLRTGRPVRSGRDK